MDKIFTTGRPHVAFFMRDKVAEMSFRLGELLDATSASRRGFVAGEPAPEGHGRQTRYALSAFLSLVQTLKDALERVTGAKVSWADLSGVRHMAFMQDARNASTHDGNPMLTLWADGRYYVAGSFEREGSFGKAVVVRAPMADMETVCREFALDFAAAIRTRIAPLVGDPALAGPIYGREFLRRAIEHPAIPAFAKAQLAEALEAPRPAPNEDQAIGILKELDQLAARADQGTEWPARDATRSVSVGD